MKGKKRVLLVTQYFYPESFKGNDIAFDLQKRGYDVTVLTGIPNYPKGHFYKGYGFFTKRIERINGVKVYRVGIIPRGTSKLQLAFNYISYTFFSFFWILMFSFKRKYDIVFVQGLSPIIQALPAILYKKIRNVPVLLWVLDVWPDAMVSGGGVKNKGLLQVMNSIVKYIYSRVDKILISSKRMTESIETKGDFEEKTIYFPNWSDDFFIENKEKALNEVKPIIPQGFVVMMAGNLGRSQDIPSVLKAAKLTSNYKNIQWVFVGEGSMKEWGEEFVEKNSLSDTVSFLGRFPQYKMKYFYSCANLMLLTLKSKYPHLKMIVPARLQSYMSAEKAIIGMIDGGGADIIKEAYCGTVVPAGDYQTLAENVIFLSKIDLSIYNKNSRDYFLKHFTRQGCMKKLMHIINSTVND